MEDISLEKVDVVAAGAAIGLGGGRTGGVVLVVVVAVGLRDWPECRVSGDWVRRGMDFVEVSEATRGFVLGGGVVDTTLVGTAAGDSVSVALPFDDDVVSLDRVFHGDDLESSADFSHAVFTGGASAAFPACSAWICCCLLRSFCDIFVGWFDLAAEAALAFCAARPAERAEVLGDASCMISRRSSFAVGKTEEAQGLPAFLGVVAVNVLAILRVSGDSCS